MKVLRLLPPTVDDGATAMALDEALLEAAAEPTLRLYSWRTATVSLGYFQDHAEVMARVAAARDPAPPAVRRITGGGAIWHEHEVTYCLVGELGSGGFPAAARQHYPPPPRAVRPQ